MIIKKNGDSLQQSILSLASDRVKESTLLILDLSDLKKKYAEKMEYLATVRDGSENGDIVYGYWINQVVASEVGSNEITPLYFSLYSQESPEFKSENVEIIKAFDKVGEALGNKGIWVTDRGGDRDKLYESLLLKRRNFIIRLVGSRNFLYQGKLVRSLWLAHACKLTQERTIVRVVEGKKVPYKLRYGFVPVHLPGFKQPLVMVVIKGFASKPMMLLTTLGIKSLKKDMWFIISICP